jgi:hypothetical protein
MPQVAFHPLPVLQEGEGLEDEENENKINDGVTINFVNREELWTLVQRCKKKKVKKDNKNEKWNKQQKENFLWFGNIYCGEPYKNYRNVDIGPSVANVPLQQHVQQLAPQPIQLSAPPIAVTVAPPPMPLLIPPIIVYSPLPRVTPEQ